MKSLMLVVLAVIALVVPAPLVAQETYKDAAGPYAVEQRLETWKDAARDRDVPVRILTPKFKEEDDAGRPGKFPVVIFSHGLGGSRDNYKYIGDHLTSHGYIVIHPSHAGSDTEALREQVRDRIRRPLRKRNERGGRDEGWLKESTSDPDNLRNRPKDISFIIDRLGTDEKLSPIADTSRIGVAGHSFGAYTGFAVAGLTIDMTPDQAAGGKDVSFRDDRVKAVVAMSPQGAGAMGITRNSWSKIAIPVLSLTGTKDYGQGKRAAAWRREGFDATKTAPAMLVVIRDATHSTFADNAGAKLTGGQISKEHDKHLRYIRMLTIAYFDAHVRGDQSAATWIGAGHLAAFDDGACAVERK